MESHKCAIINKLINITNCRNYIFCSYTRNCLFLLLKALNIGEGDEIIVPAFTCQSICEVIYAVGAKPVLVDTEVESINISPIKLVEEITSKTKMIYVIHAFGISAQIDIISKIAKENSIYLVEDLSHILNGTFNGQKLGTFGDFVILSFTKTMVSYQGGAVGTNNFCIYMKMKTLQNTLIASIERKNNHFFYYFYRLLCSIWECRGSVVVLLIFKLVSCIKGKRHINKLHKINKDFFNLSKFSFFIIDMQLSKQLSKKYITKRNNIYLKKRKSKKSYVYYPAIHEGQTGLMPNHICGSIIRKSKIKQFFSLEIWPDTIIETKSLNAEKLYKTLRLFAKKVW